MLADRVKAEREQRGWTQRDLATHSGLGQSYISQLELRRRRNPTQEVLQKLARAFGTTVTDLLGDTTADTSEFPLIQLRAAGLPPADAEHLAALWKRFPEKRPALLESAYRLAQEHTYLARLTVQGDA